MTSKEDFETQAMMAISYQVEKYMPFLELETFESDLDQDGTILKFGETDQVQGIGIINIKIKYSVPKLAITDKAMIVKIHCIG